MSMLEAGRGLVRRGREAITAQINKRDSMVSDDILQRLMEEDRTPTVMGKTEGDKVYAIVVTPPRGCSWSGTYELDAESGTYFFRNPRTQNWRAARMRWLDDETYGELVMRLDAVKERLDASNPSVPPTE